MSIPKPYHEDGDIRTFSIGINSEDLIWHFDQEDRWITVLSGDWSFQFDNKLPIKLLVGETIFIPKGIWHKIHKGTKDLIIRIKKGQSN